MAGNLMFPAFNFRVWKSTFGKRNQTWYQLIIWSYCPLCKNISYRRAVTFTTDGFYTTYRAHWRQHQAPTHIWLRGVSKWSLTSSEECRAHSHILHVARWNITPNVFKFMFWIFINFNRISIYVQVCFHVFTHWYATGHCQGAMKFSHLTLQVT